MNIYRVRQFAHRDRTFINQPYHEKQEGCAHRIDDGALNERKIPDGFLFVEFKPEDFVVGAVEAGDFLISNPRLLTSSMFRIVSVVEPASAEVSWTTFA